MDRDFNNNFNPTFMDYNQNIGPDMDNLYKDPMFNPIMQYEQAFYYYRYLCMQMDYKIKCKEYEKLCNNSIYAYRNQICEGFITVKGGHRVGISGTTIIENGKIINMKYITSLNFRIAREVKGCSLKILDKIINIKDNTINNTLIVSPPGKGKTTMLRDVIRNISNGIQNVNFQGKTCGVVDERGEIAAMYHGIPQNDIGLRTDVMENVSKAKGMRMLIRSMAPEVIACDEIRFKRRCTSNKRSNNIRSKRDIYNAW